MGLKKCLVTGGAGFIGSHIVECLIDEGYNVVVVDDLSAGKRENIPKDVKFYEKDIVDGLDSVFEIEKPSYVIHAAAQTMLRKSLEYPMEDARINVLGTISVLEACKKHGVKKLIYTSTGGARVGEPEYLPVDELHPLNPKSPYGISKHTAEHYVWMYSQLYGTDYLIFCFGNVYGPRDDPESKRVIPLFIDKMIKGKAPEIFGDGNQTRDFIYVVDLAKFIVGSLDKNPEHKLFHLANGEKVTIMKIFNILKDLSGFSGKAKHVGSVEGEVRNIVLNTSLARTELDWSPQHNLEDGLKETFNWFKDNYIS